MKLAPDSLPRHLERQLLPVYLVSGDEPLLAAEAADAIRARARALGFTERQVHSLDRGADWDAVRAAAGTLSLFAARRVIELKLPTGKPGVTGGRVLAALAESAAADTLILILTGRLDREAQSAEWIRSVEARGAWVQVSPIGADRMVAWLEARCRQLGIAADRDALEILAERTEGNLLAARQELEKLKLLIGDAEEQVAGGKPLVPGHEPQPTDREPRSADREPQPADCPRQPADREPLAGSAGRITAEQVLASAGDSARFSVGELSDALTAGELSRALRVLDGLHAEGAELPLVLWAVTRALRVRWSRQLEAGLPPAREHAIRRTFRRLVARAVRADGMAKGRRPGNAWDEIALLACELSGRAALPFPTAHRM